MGSKRGVVVRWSERSKVTSRFPSSNFNDYLPLTPELTLARSAAAQERRVPDLKLLQATVASSSFPSAHSSHRRNRQVSTRTAQVSTQTVAEKREALTTARRNRTVLFDVDRPPFSSTFPCTTSFMYQHLRRDLRYSPRHTRRRPRWL
jgi:hypothetical protein